MRQKNDLPAGLPGSRGRVVGAGRGGNGMWSLFMVSLLLGCPVVLAGYARLGIGPLSGWLWCPDGQVEEVLHWP